MAIFTTDLLRQSDSWSQSPLGISENVIRGLLSDTNKSLQAGNSSDAMHNLLMIQRLLINNNSTSTQDSLLLIRETLGALLNNRPDLAKSNLDIINNQLFPQSLSDTKVMNGKSETPERSMAQSTLITNNSLDEINIETTNTTSMSDNTTNTGMVTQRPAIMKFLNFTSPIFGIKIQYLDSWSARGYSYNKAGNNTVVGFYSPSKTASQLGNISGVSGQFVPYLDIFVFESKNMTLSEIIDGRMNRLQDTAYNVIESKPYTLKGNRQAYQIIYSTITGGDEFFKKMQVYTISSNKVYLITFTAQEALFMNYIPIVKNMIDSFEIFPVGSTLT